MPPSTTYRCALSLHDALPICVWRGGQVATPSPSVVKKLSRLAAAIFTVPPTEAGAPVKIAAANLDNRSEEHTSELQSRGHIVCRLLLEKKKKQVEVMPVIDTK